MSAGERMNYMKERPNVLLITTHDLGTHLGCYGWDPGLPTPHLDQLASEGVRFENHFCTAPYCSPSRGSIITGQYPHVNGLMGLVNLGWDIPPENTFLPAVLGRAGYETALFGFQHVAENPARLGYDHVSERGEYGCRAVATMVTDYLKKRPASPQRPFFIEAGFSEVHRPYGKLEQIPVREDDVQPLPFLQDTPGLRMDLAMFYENIRRMDQSVGDILSAVERLGLAENTLVVFTTDHGIAFPRAKATLYDPGIRTTLLMRWPQGLQGGRTIPALVSNVDLFATLVEIVHAPPPGDGNGQSFLPLLRSESAETRTAVFAEKNTAPDDIKRCIRTASHKYIRNYSEGPRLTLPVDIEVSATRRDMGDDHLAPRPSVELYDLRDDPWEQVNLAGREACRSVEKQLAARLEAILEETRDPVLRGPIPRPQGEAEIRARIWNPDAHRRRAKNEAEIHGVYERLRDKPR
jgi:arylsulfatase A-like enzyme